MFVCIWEKWQSACKKFCESFASVEHALTPVTLLLQSLAEKCYMAELKDVMQAASTMIGSLCTSASSMGDRDLKAAIAKCNEGSLIATGFSDIEKRSKASMAVNVSRDVLQLVEARAHRAKDPLPEFVSFCQLLCDLDVKLADLLLPASPLSIDVDKVKHAALVVFGMLFNEEGNEIRHEQFEEFFALRRLFRLFSCFAALFC